MIAYIQTDPKTGWPYNVNTYNAADGFVTLGYELRAFQSYAEIEEPDREAILVGGIGSVRGRLQMLGIAGPAELDYPEQLRPYLGRKVWTEVFADVLRNESLRGMFIKPKNHTKLFTGKVVNEYADFLGLVSGMEDFEVWCSEPVNFVAEYRCYIRYGAVWDIRPYKGDAALGLDRSVAEKAVADYTPAPAAYGMDFGLTDDGRTLLVEVNDGYSLGSYGIAPVRYARFLAARWAELTGTEDRCRF